MREIKNQRSDIQGMRGLAVILVLFYHLGIDAISGGYIGVDIFFVISGYLITSKLIVDLNQGKFSFINFTLKRAKRLLPALFFTIAATFFASFFIFFPNEFREIAKSVINATLAYANFGYWSETGYFDAESSRKPLLHIWSLAVEIQFYLVWPFIIKFLHQRKKLKPGLLAISICSFIASIWIMKKDSSAAFFCTQYRIWEFAAGGLVYLYQDKRTIINSKYQDFIFFIGVTAILLTSTIFSETTRFPAENALIPVIASMGLIYSGANTAMAKILTNSLMKHIGNISYSLYLVHWPVIVLVNYYLVRKLNNLEQWMLVGFIFLIGNLVYKYIENQKSSKINSNLKQSFIYLSCAGLILIPASSASRDGWIWRVPAEIQSVNTLKIDDMHHYTWAASKSFTNTEKFNTDKPKIIIAGDSQAADVLNILLSNRAADHYEIKFFHIPAICGTVEIPMQSEQAYWNNENTATARNRSLIKKCQKAQKKFFQSELLSKADDIYLAGLWRHAQIKYLRSSIQNVKLITSSTIHLVGRKDLARNSIEIINLNGKIEGSEKLASNLKNLEAIQINSELSQLAIEQNIKFIDMIKLICPTKDNCLTSSNSMPVFYDNFHLTPEGANRIGFAFSQTNL